MNKQEFKIFWSELRDRNRYGLSLAKLVNNPLFDKIQSLYVQREQRKDTSIQDLLNQQDTFPTHN